MKRALAAVGDTGAAPGSSTKESFQKRKEMREGLEGLFFLPLSFFDLISIQAGTEEMLESRREMCERQGGPQRERGDKIFFAMEGEKGGKER